MTCRECGLDMILYEKKQNPETGTVEKVYACRNPQCKAFDRRLIAAGNKGAAENT